MNKQRSSNIKIGILIGILLLTSCAPNTVDSQETSEVLPIAPSPSSTETPVPTNTATNTETSTSTPEPTATETPTITPSPTPNMVMPGTFYAGGCDSTQMSQGGRLDFCVTGVTVNGDRHMIFSVTWTLSDIPGGVTVTKRSDKGNKNMYLMDNLGNRYDHVAGGDAAYNLVNMSDGVPVSGWFDFGQPPIGAFVFELHDDDNGIAIGGISLYGGTTYQAITYTDFELDQFPLVLKYQEENWSPAKAEDGTAILVSKTMPTCSVRALVSDQPKGAYKSTVDVGKITYSIYGYFDDATGLFIREYIYISGLAGADINPKPFFFVAIPADTSLNCILDVSDLLSGLEPKQ